MHVRAVRWIGVALALAGAASVGGQALAPGDPIDREHPTDRVVTVTDPAASDPAPDR